MRRLLLLLAALSACDGTGLSSYPEPTVFGTVGRPAALDGCRPPAQLQMPLQKRKAVIPLGGGIQGNIDPKLLPLGKSLDVKNLRQNRQGEWVARQGMSTIGTGLLGTTDTLPQPWALGTLGGCLVSLSVAGVDHPVNMWSPTAGQWGTDTASGVIRTSMRGPISASTIRVSGTGRVPDIAYASGYYFVAYVGTASGVDTAVETIIDATTGEKVAERIFTDVSTIFDLGVRVVNGYAVFCRDTTANDLKFDAWQISNLDAGPTTTTFATTTGGNRPSHFDMLVKDATTISVAYRDATNAQAVDFVPSTSTATGWQPLDAAAAAIPVSLALNWMQDFGGSGKIALITQDNANGLRVHWNIPTAGATRQATNSYVMDAGAINTIDVTGHTRTSAATGEFTVLYDVGATFDQLKGAGRIGGVITTGAIGHSVILASKTWTQGGDYYVLGQYRKTGQVTRYVFRVSTTGVAASNGTVAPLAMAQMRNGSANQFLSPAVSPSANTWVVATPVQLRVPSQPTGYNPADFGVELVKMSFQTAPGTTLGSPREAIGNLFVPGGALGQFDGTTFAEAGFSRYPEQPVLTPNVGGANTYWYAITYGYPDANGRMWRSAPSIAKSVGTNAAIGGGGSVTVAIPNLAITNRTDLINEVWRTVVGSSSTGTFQKVGSLPNDPTTDTSSLVDNVPDATQASGEFLYTNGGILPNDSIPGFTAIAVAGNRLFGISGDDHQRVWVSNLFVDGQGLRFSEENVLTIRDQHGDLTGLAAQPSGIVLAFKGDAVYAITGNGPDAAGNGGFNVSIVALGLGTTNPRSIVESSDGAEFISTSSKAGWYRINLGQVPEYIGGPVQGYVAETIVGAVLVPSLSETHYYTASSLVLVHNLITDVWSVDTTAIAGTFVAAVAYGNGSAIANSNAKVILDNQAVNFDTDGSGAFFTPTLETPWIKLGELKGYERFYRIQGVGETVTTHAVTVALYKDFDGSSPILVKAINPPGALWDWELRWSAKFSAIKIKISQDILNNGAGGKMSALAIEYGVKAGLGKLPASNRLT